MTISAICLEHLFSHMLVHTPWRRRRNAMGAPCALCARRRYAVTTLCTPRARRGRSVTTQSIAGQNSVGARGHAVGAPRKRHCRRGRAVTSPRYGKCKIIRYIFLYFRAIPRRSEKFQIAVPTPWDRSRVWQGLNLLRPSDTYARYETTAIHHWFRWWLVAWSAPSHYLYQCWKFSIVLSGRNISQI